MLKIYDKRIIDIFDRSGVLLRPGALAACPAVGRRFYPTPGERAFVGWDGLNGHGKRRFWQCGWGVVC